MLNRERRINAPDEFRAITRRGQKLTAKNLRVYVVSTDTPTRFGFIVSKAVSKRAVTRNLVKRRLRAVAAAATLELPSGFDVVVFALPTAASATYAELEADLRTALRLRR